MFNVIRCSPTVSDKRSSPRCAAGRPHLRTRIINVALVDVRKQNGERRMSFEQGMMQDLADVVIFDRWRAQRLQLQSEDHLHDVPHVSSLLLIRSEIVLAAPMIATVTCLANSLEADEAGDLEAGMLGHFVPLFSDTPGQSLNDLRRDHRFYSLVQAWQRLHGQLRLAKGLTLALSATADPACRRARVDVEAVADAWRRAARLCHDLHAKTVAKLKADGVTADTYDESAVMALLDDAAKGGAGCLDADGLISIPKRAERRLSTRVAVAFPVSVLTGDVSVSATAINASTTGLGLRLDAPLRAGENVTVRIPGGRLLSGAVIWSLRDKAGIKLATRLAADDAIFCK